MIFKSLLQAKSDYYSQRFEDELSSVCKHQKPSFFQHFLEIPQEISVVTGLYFLLYGPSVIYVGQSTDLIQRSWHHLKDKKFDRVYALQVPNEFLNYLEAAFVAKFKPAENGRRNKKTYSCGAYCVRDRLSFSYPDLAIRLFFNLKKNNFKKAGGHKASIHDLREDLKALVSQGVEELKQGISADYWHSKLVFAEAACP